MHEGATLFDPVEQRIAEPLPRDAPWFALADRLASTPWVNIAETLERWYGRYPDPTRDLRARIRTPGQNSQGALFELMLHELFLSMGLSVEAGPGLPSSAADFLVAAGGRSAYVEATVVEGDRDDPHEQQVIDAINDLDDEVPGHLGVVIACNGALDATPRLRSIKRRVREWLAAGSADRPAALRIPPPDVSGTWRATIVATTRTSGQIVQGVNRDVHHYGKSVQEALNKKARQHPEAAAPIVMAANDVNLHFDNEPIPAVWESHPRIGAVLLFQCRWWDADDWTVRLAVNPKLAQQLPVALLGLADAHGPSIRERLHLPRGWPDPDRHDETWFEDLMDCWGT